VTTVAYKDGVMAADKMASRDGLRAGNVTKVFKRKGYLIGFSGRVDVAALLLRWFENGAKEDEFPGPGSDDELDYSMIVVTPKGVVMFYERFPIPIIMDGEYFAIGSGRDFAIAAMYMGCDAVRAVEVASALDCYSGNGVDSVCLGAAAN
jgi:20S proteasome alpha/beta subunit